MEMEPTFDPYRSSAHLLRYMQGSAGVIAELMSPILEPVSGEAIPRARELGIAFQLTNFLRDVAEDLERGRVYLPQTDLGRFGADPWSRRVTPEWVALMEFEIERVRQLYRVADEGIALLPETSARCVRAARCLYSEILDRIERAGYDVFAARARVPAWRKALVVSQLVAGRA